MAVKYTVNLSEAEREQLRSITSKGKTTGRIVKRAQILLLADEGYSDETISSIMKQLVDDFFPEATKVQVVLDNLNTHTPAALYQTFAPSEAKRILDRIEFHYTPKHGSWLNMVEIELSVLSRQCLKRRIPDLETMKQETASWEKERNQQQATVNWRFSNQDARVKLKRLYPQLNLS